MALTIRLRPCDYDTSADEILLQVEKISQRFDRLLFVIKLIKRDPIIHDFGKYTRIVTMNGVITGGTAETDEKELAEAVRTWYSRTADYTNADSYVFRDGETELKWSTRLLVGRFQKYDSSEMAGELNKYDFVMNFMIGKKKI